MTFCESVTLSYHRPKWERGFRKFNNVHIFFEDTKEFSSQHLKSFATVNAGKDKSQSQEVEVTAHRNVVSSVELSEVDLKTNIKKCVKSCHIVSLVRGLVSWK